jgi:hypothetical protein
LTSNRFGEGVEISGDDVDWGDPVRFECAQVRGIVAAGKQPAVDVRVQRFDPAVEDLREGGDIADRGHRYTGRLERGQRAAGGDELVTKVDQTLSQRGNPRLVIDAQQRPHRHLMPTLITRDQVGATPASPVPRRSDARSL